MALCDGVTPAGTPYRDSAQVADSNTPIADPEIGNGKYRCSTDDRHCCLNVNPSRRLGGAAYLAVVLRVDAGLTEAERDDTVCPRDDLPQLGPGHLCIVMPCQLLHVELELQLLQPRAEYPVLALRQRPDEG